MSNSLSRYPASPRSTIQLLLFPQSRVLLAIVEGRFALDVTPFYAAIERTFSIIALGACCSSLAQLGLDMHCFIQIALSLY